MSAEEADEVTVRSDDHRADRVLISVRHGNYGTSLRVSESELRRIRDAIDAHLSSPPADDTERRETFAAMRRVDDEINGTQPADDVREALAREIDPGVWAEMQPHPSIYMDEPGSREVYEKYFREGLDTMRAPSLAAADRLLASTAFEVRPYGTVTDTEVEAAADAICMAAEGVVLVDARMSMREQYRREARAALDAAREARS